MPIVTGLGATAVGRIFLGSLPSARASVYLIHDRHIPNVMFHAAVGSRTGPCCPSQARRGTTASVDALVALVCGLAVGAAASVTVVGAVVESDLGHVSWASEGAGR